MKATDFLNKMQQHTQELMFNTVNRTFIEAPQQLTQEVAELCYNFNFKVIEVVVRHSGNGCVILNRVNDTDCLKRLLNFEYPEIYNF